MKTFLINITFCIILLSAPAKAKHFSSSRYATLVVDSESGNILHQENADQLRYPASLTKMMTLYLTFERIKRYRMSFNQYLTVSANAANSPSSKLGLKTGEKIKIYDLVVATIVKSANDASVVLAEAIGNTEEIFAQIMTNKAKALGMNNTSFKNASGLHHFEQKTTAHDIAKLAIALNRDFPEYYHLFSKTSFIYKNQMYYGHNAVLKKFPGANGLKTGFTNASGFNIVTSASRGKSKLIAVVMGGDSPQARDSKTMQLLNRYLTDSTMVNTLAKFTTPAQKPSINKPKKTYYNKSNTLPTKN
jgi:D-alanyl-D-alanine carboxypeptidase